MIVHVCELVWVRESMSSKVRECESVWLSKVCVCEWVYLSVSMSACE